MNIFFFSRGLLFRFLLLDTTIMKNSFFKKRFIQHLYPSHGPEPLSEGYGGVLLT